MARAAQHTRRAAAASDRGLPWRKARRVPGAVAWGPRGVSSAVDNLRRLWIVGHAAFLLRTSTFPVGNFVDSTGMPHADPRWACLRAGLPAIEAGAAPQVGCGWVSTFVNAQSVVHSHRTPQVEMRRTVENPGCHGLSTIHRDNPVDFLR